MKLHFVSVALGRYKVTLCKCCSRWDIKTTLNKCCYRWDIKLQLISVAIDDI